MLIHDKQPMRRELEIKYHCFISYTTREAEVRAIKPFVDRFVDELDTRGLIVAPFFYDHLCLDNRDYPSSELCHALATGVAESVCMISFVSSGYLSSPWCLYEWGTMDGIQMLRGPRFSAVLPIVWKPLNKSERDFVNSRRHLDIEDAYPQHLDHPGEMARCVHETVRFVIEKQRDLEGNRSVSWSSCVLRIPDVPTRGW